LGSHGRRLHRGLILCLLLLFPAACSEEKENGFVPAPGRGEAGSDGRDVVDRIEGEDSLSSTRTEILDATRPLVEKGALRSLTRPNSNVFNHAMKAVMEIMAFRRPWEMDEAVSFDPSTVKAVREAFLGAYQRGGEKGKRQCVADLEIFLVFHNAYKEMTPDQREELFDRWKREKGEGEPPRQSTGSYPLFWLREHPVLWDVSRGAWWWTYNALKDDRSFSYSREDGAFFTSPGGAVYTSWRPE